MSEDHRTKHIAVRFTEDDLAWLNEQAGDEGVEPATLVRMIVARLRKGRAPLVSMMSAAPMAPRMVSQAPRLNYEATPMYEPVEPEGDPSVAEDVLNARLAELDGADVVPLHQPEAEPVAISLRRVERQQYNPGRR